MTLGSWGVVTSLLLRSGNDNPQRLYKYIIKSNIVNKTAPEPQRGRLSVISKPPDSGTLWAEGSPSNSTATLPGLTHQEYKPKACQGSKHVKPRLILSSNKVRIDKIDYSQPQPRSGGGRLGLQGGGCQLSQQLVGVLFGWQDPSSAGLRLCLVV